LTVILLGFNNAAPGGWLRSRMRGGYGAQLVRRAARGRCLGGRAVRFRGKASGRRVVRWVPAGRIAPAFAVRAISAAVMACAVTRRQARRAARALDDRKESPHSPKIKIKLRL
jgi:hypothetical protein